MEKEKSQKDLITVCMGTVSEDCQEVLNDRGFEFESKDEAEAFDILEIVRLSHGLCEKCSERLEDETNRLSIIQKLTSLKARLMWCEITAEIEEALWFIEKYIEMVELKIVGPEDAERVFVYIRKKIFINGPVLEY